uniref:Uncharacterized protein n=1 Tax=Streptomyces avermitilis TaxID=33903 RepID=A0A499VCW0_STRAX|nr:hypothetical protein SAVMC3_33190 [Streptomyces avermitilis]
MTVFGVRRRVGGVSRFERGREPRGRRVVVEAERVEGVRVGAQLVALPQQRSGLHEAQGKTLGLEPEVARPVRLVLGEDPADRALEEFEAARAVEAAEEDLFEQGVGGGRRYIGRGRDQEGALGRGVEQLVERAAAELHVVQDDDRADLVDEPEQFLPLRPVEIALVNGGEEVVEEVARGAPVAGEADDAVGGEVRAVLGHGVQQDGAAGAGGAGEADGAAAREEPYEPLALLLALQERQPGPRRSGRDGRLGGAGGLGALGRSELHRPGWPLARRAGLYLAAVDGVDGEQVVARDELDGAGDHRRVLSEV